MWSNKVVLLCVSIICVCISGFSQSKMRQSQYHLSMSSSSGSISKQWSSAIIAASLLWGPPTLPVNAATRAAPSALKSALGEYKQKTGSSTIDTQKTTATTPTSSTTNTAAAIVPKVEEKSTQQLQREAKEATAAVVVQAPPPSNPTKPTSSTKPAPIKEAPKTSVEQIAYEASQIDLQNLKERNNVLSKVEIPKAKKSLDAAKKEQYALEKSIVKVESQLNDRKLIDKEKRSSLSTERGELKKKLAFVNQEVRGFDNAYGRFTKELEQVRDRTKKGEQTLKERKEKLQAKEVYLKKEAKIKADQKAKKELEEARNMAKGNFNFAKGKEEKVTKELSTSSIKLDSLNKDITKLNSLLKTQREAESKRIISINKLRTSLQKETDLLTKEQETIVNLQNQINTATTTKLGVDQEVKSEKESLILLKEKSKNTEQILKKLQ